MHGAQYHSPHPKPSCLERTQQYAETCSPGNYFPTLDTFPKNESIRNQNSQQSSIAAIWLRSTMSFELPEEPDFVFVSRRGIPLTIGNFSEHAIQTREFCESPVENKLQLQAGHTRSFQTDASVGSCCLHVFRHGSTSASIFRLTVVRKSPAVRTDSDEVL